MQNWKMKSQIIFIALLLTALGCTSSALAGSSEKKMKTGILLTAFGTSIPEAQKVFDRIDQRVKTAFPNIEVRWAYTSSIIRKKLAARGERLDSPAAALAKMMDDGFTHAAVQSLHTIPGSEYHGLLKTVQAFSGMPKGMKQVKLGLPLLAAHEDMLKTRDALLATIPKDRKPDEAVIFMGHGTHHPANVYYPGLQYYLWQKDPHIFVGTVEGAPALDDILPALKAQNVKKAWLMPFMAVAGDHAINDMAGDKPDSWKSILTAQGFECVPVLIGTASSDAIVDIWVEHLSDAFKGLK